MKLYVLKPPEFGYLAGNRNNKYLTPNIQFARKFNRRCDASNCKNTSYYSYKIKDYENITKQFEVIELSIEHINYK